MHKNISVIIPVYNQEWYLETCLDSVLNQEGLSIEVICIDDGSVDQSLKLLKNFQQMDNRITVIHQENKGVAAARNLGLKKASAEYVCFMDPDDFYPDKHVLEDLYAAAKVNQALICGGAFSDYYHDTGEVVTTYTDPYKPYMFDKDGMIDYRDYQFDYGYHRFIYSRKMLIDNHIFFPPYKRFQDPPFFVKAMFCAGKFYALNRVTYRYRCGHQEINWTLEKLIDLSKGICENLSFSEQHGLNELHAYTVQRLIDHGYAYINNRDLFCDERLQEQVCNLLLSVRKDMLQKSSYQVDLSCVFQLVRSIWSIVNEKTNALETEQQHSMEWQMRYEALLNSETFKIGKAIAWLPRQFKLILKGK